MTKPAESISLAEQVRAGQFERRQRAGAKYYELLARNDNPRSGDFEALSECMSMLGRTADDLEDDLALVRQLAEVDAAKDALAKLTEPLAAVKAKRGEVTAAVTAERERMTAQWKQQIAEVESAVHRLAVQRSELSAPVANEPTLRGQWDSLVTGRSVDAIREARRAARHAEVIHGSAGPSREDIIEACRHETVVLRLRPTDGTPAGMVARVNAELVAAGYTRLTESEIQKHGVRQWLADADNRPRTAKEREAPKGDAQVAHAG